MKLFGLELKFNGFDLWHTGNFDPAGKADKTYVDTQLVTKQAAVTGAATSVISANLTASMVLVSDASGKVAAHAAVTATELGYLDGATSAIQTQLNGKQASITGGATTITGSNLTASRALVSDASGKVAVLAVTSTELGYISGVTSSVQTQLNGKAASSHTHTKSQITDMPSKLSQLENDIGAGAGLKISPGATEPAGLVTGDWWYEEI